MKILNLPDSVSANLDFMYPIFDILQDGIIITDVDSNILYVNPKYLAVTGFDRDEFIGQNPGMVRSGYHDANFYKKIWEQIKADGRWSGEFWNRRKNGQTYACSSTIQTIRNKTDFKVCYLGVTSDISYSKFESVKKLNLSLCDLLTRLPNKLYSQEVLQKLTVSFTAQGIKHEIGLFYFEVDGVSKVNDTYGYTAGDKLICKVADRLRDIVGDKNLLSRISGSKFSIIISQNVSDESLNQVQKNLESVCTDLFHIDDAEIKVKSKIGLAKFPLDADSLDKLIEIAANNSK